MRPLHRLALPCFALAFLSGVSSAQNTASKPLIVERVNENQLITLRGNVPPAATAKNDRGRVSPDMRMSGLVLVLRRSPEQQAAFDSFVASQYDATSPNFHHWLQPAEVGEKFGPAPTDIATVSSWLGSHGLSVDGVSQDRMTIRFGGSAAQVEAAFHTEIHNLLVNGQPHISNMSDPQIPMALDPVVLGPKALHNFVPRPLHRLGGKATLNPETGKWQRVLTPNLASGGVRPDFGITNCGGSTCLLEDVAPYDFATIYNVLPLWNASSPIDGTGQTIAIAGTSDVRTTDVATFRSTFGLPAGTFNTIHNLEAGTVDPGYCTGTTGNCTIDDQIENALDVEWSGAVAKGATIDLVVTQSTNTNDAVFDSSQYVINHLTAPVLNVSYGLCELFEGTSGNNAYNTLWQSASTEGIAVFVATGDSGSPSCDQGAAQNGPYGAQFGLSVNGLASTQYDTAVGGTDFNWGSTAAPYWNTTNNTTNGSTAIGYIPEFPWNDSCTNPLIVSEINTALKTNLSASQICYELAVGTITTTPEQAALDLVNSVGGRGGASNCTVNSTTNSTTTPNPASCSGGYPKPTWQTGVSGIPTDSLRDIPDVSFFAGNGFFGSAYLICVSDMGACVTSPTAMTEPAGEIGGTSAATPAMAGVMALINQKAGSAQGHPNSVLYALAGKQNYSSCTTESVTASSSCYFNDIDTGTIAMPCAAGSPNCTVAATGNTYGVLTGFAAGAAYDEATGLGSLNVANVVNGWSGTTTGTATATVGVSASPTTITSGQGTTVTVTVTGASGTPTGTVVLTSGTFASATKSLSSGSVTFNLSPGVLSVGTDTLQASYSGDSTYAAANGTTTVTVTPLPTPTVTVTPAASSINSGQSLNVTAAVAGTGGTPTGTVTLSSGSYTSSAQPLASGSATIAIPANSLSAGTDTLTVSYSGDSNFSTATGTGSVTVAQSTYALAATAPASIGRGTSATSTITWTTTNNYSANVTLGTCTLNAGSPTNSATDTPQCTVSTAAIGSGASGTATVTTKAATTAALKRPAFPGLAVTGSGAILALVVFFGIPARRRSWRAMLGMFLLMVTLGSLAACGGGGSSSGGGGGGGTSDPGTASGSYVFTVNSTGSDPAKTTATTTFTVTVN